MSSEPSSKRKTLSLLTNDQHDAIAVARKGNRIIKGDMGSGKTIIAATAIADLLGSNTLNKVLIVTTPKIANTVWQQEFNDWNHICHIQPAIASGIATPEERVTCCKLPQYQVVVTTFNLLPFFKKHDLYKYFDGLLIDETTKLVAAGGKHTSSLKHYAKGFKWRLGLTATPVNEKPENVYTQALLIDLGKAFGTRKESFRQTYFYPTDYQQRNWQLHKHLESEFYDKCAQIFYQVPDYRHELPPISIHTIPIEAPPIVTETYNHFMKTNKIGDYVAPTAGVARQKQAQIINGFYYLTDEEENPEITWLSKYRIKSISKLLMYHGIGNVIVAFNFVAERDALLSEFPQAELLTAQNEIDLINRWNSGDVLMLLVHAKSAAHGIQLQHGGHTIIWASNQWSNDAFEQLNARVHRRGQKHRVDVYLFESQLDRSIDKDMQKRIAEKQDYAQTFTKEIGDRQNG